MTVSGSGENSHKSVIRKLLILSIGLYTLGFLHSGCVTKPVLKLLRHNLICPGCFLEKWRTPSRNWFLPRVKENIWKKLVHQEHSHWINHIWLLNEKEIFSVIFSSMILMSWNNRRYSKLIRVNYLPFCSK